MTHCLRVGVGGPVGSGKTALLDALCKAMRDHYQLAVVTNDSYTQEDAKFLGHQAGVIPTATIAQADLIRQVDRMAQKSAKLRGLVEGGDDDGEAHRSGHVGKGLLAN